MPCILSFAMGAAMSDITTHDDVLKLLLTDAIRALDHACSRHPSRYLAAACLFAEEVEKEVRGERAQPMSPTLQLALRDWAVTAARARE